MNEPKMLRVATASTVSSVAGAVAGVIREQSQVDLQAIGMHAVNQAARGIALAGQFLAQEGVQITTNIACVDVEMDTGRFLSAVRFSVSVYDKATRLAV